MAKADGKLILLTLNLFNWHKETRTLTAEVSNLPLPSKMPFHILIENPQTQQSRVFRKENIDRDEEGDIVAWQYVNLSHGLKLTIWND